MKKVRNVLILALAALMLTVFISCDPAQKAPDTPEEITLPAADRVVKQEANLDQDLVVTHVYIGADGTNFIAIKNINADKTFDFTGIKLGTASNIKTETDLNAVASYTNAAKLGSTKLAPGATIYIASKDASAYAEFPAFADIVYTEPVSHDIFFKKGFTPNGNDALAIISADKVLVKIDCDDTEDLTTNIEKPQLKACPHLNTLYIRNIENGNATGWSVYAADNKAAATYINAGIKTK